MDEKIIKTNTSIKNILIVRDGRIGDLLMTTPVINCIANKYPEAKIDVMIGQYGNFVYESNPKINKIVNYNKKASLCEHINLIFKLRKNKYDLIVVMESNSHYKILSYFISSKMRIGISGKLDCLLNYCSPWDTKKHAIINNLNILQPLLNNKAPSTEMSLFLSNKDIRDAVLFLEKRHVDVSSVIVFIQIACGPNDLLRSWSSKNIAILSDMLIQNIGAVVILNSGPGEEMKANKILTLMKNKPIINDTNINLTASLIKLSNIFIGLDTGTTHIANALKTPLVVLFGPTSIEDCGPIASDGRIVIQKKLDCRPCFNSEESLQKCKCIKQGESNCMKEIEVSEVYLSIQSLLTKFTKDRPINI